MTSGDAIVIADASALHAISASVKEEAHPELWPLLTECVEQHKLGFPREVVADLAVIARYEPVAAWSAGLGRTLNPFQGNIRYARPLMGIVRKMGYTEGFETIEGREPGIACLGRLAMEYQDSSKPFVVVTNDLGPGILSPTLEELCNEAQWKTLSIPDCMIRLGVADIRRDAQ